MVTFNDSCTLPHGLVSRALLIESDEEQAGIVISILGALSLESVWVRRGFDGLAALRNAHFDLLVVDLDLSDMSGLDLLKTLQLRQEQVCTVAIGRAVTVPVAIKAMSLGVHNVLKRPLDVGVLITALNVALASSLVRRPTEPPSPSPAQVLPATAVPSCSVASDSVPSSAAARWATMVLDVIAAEHDPKTIAMWAKLVGVSRSVLCECCRLVHVPARDARDFARLMRAVHRCGDTWLPETVLELADTRTLRKLLSRAGFLKRISRTPSPREFLEHQQWIPGDNPGLQALERLLVQRQSR